MQDRALGAADEGAGHPLPGLSRWLEGRERWVVLAIGLLALGLRLWHLWQIAESDPFFDHPAVDPKVYHEWAARIAGGDWLGEDVFFLSPLYPYFLGVLYWLAGPSLLVARLVQMVLGALDCVLVFLVARRAFGAAVAAIAGLAMAVYAVSIFYDGVLLVAAIQTPLNLLLAWLLLRAERAPSLPRWLMAGACLGLSILARPNVLLLALLIPPWIVLALKGRVPLRRAGLAAAVFLVAAAAVVLPVTARNYAVGGDAVLVSSQGGVNFYIGNGPDAIGSFRVPRLFPKTRADDPLQQQEAYRSYAEHRAGGKLTPSEVSDFWYDETWAHIRGDPGGWARLLIRKLGLFLNHYEIGNSRDFYSSRQFSTVLGLPLPTFGVICPLALLGLVVAVRRQRRAYPLYAMVATYAVSLVAFFVLAHYRLPVVPFFVVFAALGLAWLLDRIARFRAAPVLAAIVGLTAAVAVTQLDLVDEDQARFMVHYNLGNKYRLLGRRDLALAEYERSIALDPTYISAQHNLALLSEEQPMHLERAIAAWKEVERIGLATGDREYVERARRHLFVLEQIRARERAP